MIVKLAGSARRHPWVIDVAIAAAFLLADLKEMKFFHSILGPMGEIASWRVIVGILLFRAGLMAFRRRFPLAVSVVLSATFISIPTNGLEYILTGGASPPDTAGPGWWPTVISYTSMLEILVSVYTVTSLRGTRLGILAGAWFALCVFPWAMPQVIIGGPGALLFFSSSTAIAVYLGRVRGGIHAAIAAIAERNRLIEDGRRRAAQDAAQAERERISTELQTLVSRNLERMVDEAAHARMVIGGKGDASNALDTIHAIERTGRMALDDARRALGLLRDAPDHAPLAPPTISSVGQQAAPSVPPASSISSQQSGPRRRRNTGDGALALVMLALLISEVGFSRTPAVWPHSALSLIAHPTDIGAIVLLTVPLALRRRTPLLAALAAALGFGLLGAAGHFFGLSSFVALLIAVYSLWAERGIRVGIASVTAAALAIPAAATELAATNRFGLVTAYVPFLSGACLLGLQERRLRLARSRLEDQEIELRRLAEEDLERARREERVRIARELHDVTAHSLSVMVIQAGAARMVAAAKPEKARRALAAVEEAGRQAQADLERLFAVEIACGHLDSRSLPSLSSLPALALQMRGAGLDVEIQATAELGSLSPGLDLSLYRVVQEALTNVAKHAGPTRVRVRLASEDGGLVLEIEDEGPQPQHDAPAAVSAGGRGLLGMSERVGAFGGAIRAGRRGGGFAVRVQVPLSTGILTSPQ